MYPRDKVIERGDPSLPPSTEASGSARVKSAAKSRPAERAADATVIAVTIISTLKARTHHTDWLSTAQAAITDANTTFALNEVPLTFAITSYGDLINYDETDKTFDQMLADLSAAPGVQSWRDSTNSDLVAIFRDDTGLGNQYCGMAYYTDSPSAATSAYAYSIDNIGCAVANHTFVHEAGHNMGLTHDRYAEGAIGVLQDKYNYGYSAIDCQVRTVMAYANYCNDNGATCTRIDYLSDPSKTYNGCVLGVDVGSTDPAHNARRVDETKEIIAGYR